MTLRINNTWPIEYLATSHLLKASVDVYKKVPTSMNTMPMAGLCLAVRGCCGSLISTVITLHLIGCDILKKIRELNNNPGVNLEFIVRSIPAPKIHGAMSRHQITCATLIAILVTSGSLSGQVVGVAPANCPAPQGLPARPVLDEVLQPGAVYLSSDSVESIEGGISRLQGNAEFARDTQQARAGLADYDQAAGTVVLKGAVDYWDDDLYLHGESAQINIAEKSASLSDARYRVLSNRGHGQAGELHVIADQTSEGLNIDYTTCDPVSGEAASATESWKLSAEKITLDHVTNWGVGRNVVLKIKDIPVFYTPYISFPLNNERKTGFLTPVFGNSRRNGFEVQTPFYWNIAPNMDATITPRLITDSGLMLMGEYRYLFENSHGWITGEFLPSDGNYHDQDRSYLALEHEHTLPYNGNLHVLFNNLSDDRYLEDFGPSLEVTSLSAVERFVNFSYSGDNWLAYARVQDFQTIDQTELVPPLSPLLNPQDINSAYPIPLDPYKRLPQLGFNYTGPRQNQTLNFKLDSEFVYFKRNEPGLGLNPAVLQPLSIAPNIFLTDMDGMRFDINPSVSYPIRNLGSFIEPKVGLRYTAYQLDDAGPFNDTPDRLLPYASLDGGLFLEREINLFDKLQTQTLEPRIYYLYTPKEDQQDLPVFDTGLYDDSFDTLFYENRYTGADRVNDANRVTLALTSRLLNTDGWERGHLSIGQMYYFDAQEVTLPGQVIQDPDLSPLVFEFGANLDQQWSLLADWQWETNAGRWQKLDLQARYRSETGKVLNVAYRIRQAMAGVIRTDAIDVEQTDVSMRWPISGQLNVVGRWIYALEEHKSLDIFGGIEYDSCCWGVRLVGRRFVSNIEGDVQTGIFLQFELKGLAGVGQKTVDFLNQNIPGYQNEF
ncbi:MAG: Organic solvent tolerance protein [Gammaproteobacteria bacterium]|nr:Organic solvent tolerance protein [Gammaproteobacteria bacterium]